MTADITAGGLGEEGDRLFHEAVTAAARSPLLAEFMAVDAQLADPVGTNPQSRTDRPDFVDARLHSAG